MTGHIIKLAQDLIKVTEISYDSSEYLNFFNVSKMIYNEIKDLKSTEFNPSVRYDFVIIKDKIKGISSRNTFSGADSYKYKQIARRLIEILNQYDGRIDNLAVKNFDFLTDTELKKIVKRDYRELSVILFPEGAWKSVVILAGSILEAMLSDVLSNQINREQANESPVSPSFGIETGKWSLQKLIEVSIDIKIIPADRGSSIDQVLRDYRNFVHPKKEIRSKHQCNEAEALMAKGALDGIYNHFSRSISPRYGMHTKT